MDSDRHIEIECQEVIPIFNDECRAQEYLYDRTIQGQIWLFSKNDKPIGEVGRMWLYILDGNRAYCANDDIKEWCEEHSNDMYDYVKNVYEDGKIKPEFRYNKKNNNTLIFHWLEIYPEYRKKGYGDQIVKAVLQRYGDNCGAIVVHPHPLQYSVELQENGVRSKWAKKMKFNDFKSADEKTAFKKVAAFWTRMGFKKIPYHDIYYFKDAV